MTLADYVEKYEVPYADVRNAAIAAGLNKNYGYHAKYDEEKLKEAVIQYARERMEYYQRKAKKWEERLNRAQSADKESEERA